MSITDKKIREIYPEIMRVSLSLTRYNRENAEDLVQKALMKAFEKQKLFKGGNLVGWIVRIMEGCEEKHVLPQGWRVTKLKYCDYKEILLQRLKVTRLEILEEKQVPSQGWRVKRHEGWKEKQVQPTGWSVTRLEGWEDKQVLYTD